MDAPDREPHSEIEKMSYSVQRTESFFAQAGLQHPDHYLLMIALFRAYRHLTAWASDLLDRRSLKMSHYTLLMALAIRGADRPLLLSRLAKRMMVHPTTVTLRMDDLEKQGLVRRAQHPSDRRAVLASLTKEGESVVDEIMREMAGFRFGLEGLAPETAREIIEKMVPILSALPDEEPF